MPEGLRRRNVNRAADGGEGSKKYFRESVDFQNTNCYRYAPLTA
jgi:hypothetical protein